MYYKILVPIDGSPLSEAALEHLRHVAGPDSEVILLRVMDVAGEPVPAASGQVTFPPPLAAGSRMAAAAEEATAKTFVDVEEHLNALASALRGHVRTVRTLVIGDTDPAAAIAAVAENEQVALILMSTHGRSGIVRWMLGSVAEKVLHRTHRPILLIRPSRPLA